MLGLVMKSAAGLATRRDETVGLVARGDETFFAPPCIMNNPHVAQGPNANAQGDTFRPFLVHTLHVL